MPYIGDADVPLFFFIPLPPQNDPCGVAECKGTLPLGVPGPLWYQTKGEAQHRAQCLRLSRAPSAQSAPPAQPTETPSQSQVVNFSLLNHSFGLQISASRRNYTITTYYSNCLYACNENLVLPSPPGGMGIACTVLGMHMHAMRRSHRLSQSFNRANQKGHGTL